MKGGSARNQATRAGAAPQGEGFGGGGGVADRLKQDPGLLGRGRGGLTSPEDRRKALKILDAARAAGARDRALATAVRGWLGRPLDRCKGSHRLVTHRLTDEERQRILLTCNQPEFAALPPGQIVSILADRGLYIGSEHSLYHVLHAQ